MKAHPVCCFSVVSARTCQPFPPCSSSPTTWQYPFVPGLHPGGWEGSEGGGWETGGWLAAQDRSGQAGAPALCPLDVLPPWRHLPGVWEWRTRYLQRPGGFLGSAHSWPGLWSAVW